MKRMDDAAKLGARTDAGQSSESPEPKGAPTPTNKLTDVPGQPSEQYVQQTEQMVENAPKAVRKRGLFGNTGAVGGRQSVRVQPESQQKKDDGDRVQDMYDRQNQAIKKAHGNWLKRIYNQFMRRTVDVGHEWKQAVMKNTDGKQVVMWHALSQGASGHALAKWEAAEKDIYSMLHHHEEDIFANYLQSMRTIEAEGLKAAKGEKLASTEGMGADMHKAWVEKFKRQQPEVYKRVHAAAQKYWDTMAQTVKDMHDAGLIDAKTRDTLLRDHKHYSPRRFIQHIDPETATVQQGKKINVRDSGLKALDKGSEEAMMHNPRLLLAQVLGGTTARIARNRANRAMWEFAEKNAENEAGIISHDGDPGEPGTGYERVYYMRDGKRQAIDMPKEIADAWQYNDPQMNSAWAEALKVMSGSALLKPMATGLNPGFAIANLPRDIFHSWFAENEYSAILPIAWAQQAADFVAVAGDVWKRKGIVNRYIKDGGSMDYLTTQGAIYNKKPWQQVTATDETMRGIQKAIGYLGETSELWTRMALKHRAEINGLNSEEATWVARRYIDFALGGSWTKAADAMVPYLNASIQGTRGVMRAYKNNPKVAIAKTAQLVALGALAAYWNRLLNREAWEAISDTEKSTKWIITTPFSYLDKDGEKRYVYFGIPKDQGQQIFATIGEMLMERAQGGKPNIERLERSASNFFPVDAAKLFPPTIQAFGAYAFNKDFWLNDDVWKRRKDVDPENEFYNETPEVWVLWGKATGMSPERSRRAFNKVIPQNAYTMIGEAFAGQLFGSVSDAERVKIDKPFAEHLTDLPIARRVVRKTWPTGKRMGQLVEKAAKYDVEMHDKNGEPLTLHELEREIERAEKRVGNKRIEIDRKFDALAVPAQFGSEDAQKQFLSELEKLRENDTDEYKRVRRRMMERYPNIMGGKWVAAQVFSKDNPRWKERVEFLSWYRKQPPAEKREFGKVVTEVVGKKDFDYPSEFQELVKKTTSDMMDYFSNRFDKLHDQLIDGKLSRSEYDEKLKELKRDQKWYADMMKGN
jgi:hypothetical protein